MSAHIIWHYKQCLFTIWKCFQGAFVSFPLDIERSNRQTIGVAADSSVGVFRG